MECNNKKFSLLKNEQDYFYKKELLLKVNICNQSAGNTTQGKLKGFLKKFNHIYNLLIVLFGPVMPSIKLLKKKKEFLTSQDQEIILNLGAGPITLKNKNVLNVDIFPFKNIDFICDAHDLPMRDSCIDKILNLSLLEHVKKPDVVISEMHRVLKPGGKVLCFIPFLQPYHAAPYDFNRWTISGAKELFSCFSSVEIFVGAGATSSLLWVFLEWVATFLSFGCSHLRDIIFLSTMVLLSPLKILDLLLEFLPGNEFVASGFVIIARK
ncbi:MAG: class I SAM-dependent methyltransferase [Bdellovibrionota bacterium]